MALSSNRKSNSSASRTARPTYRRAKGSSRPKAKASSSPRTPKTARAAKPKTASAGMRSGARKGGRSSLKVSSAPRRAAAPSKPRQGKASVSARPDRRAGANRASMKRAGIFSMPLARLVALVAGVCLTVLVLWIVITNSPIFSVTDVVVNGTEHVPQEMAEQLVDVPDGRTLFNIDEGAIEASLKQNPWVERVNIERQFPHTVVITPVEHDVAAIAYITSGDVAWAIGTNGTWIAPISLSVTVDDEGNIVSTTGEMQGSVDSSSGADDDASAESEDGTQDDTDTAPDASSDDAVSDDASSDDASAEDGSSDGSDSDAEGNAEAGGGADGDKAAGDDNVLTGLEAAFAVAQQSDAILFINIPADVEPSSGAEVTSDVILAGIQYANEFSPEFIAQVEEISLESIDAISANLANGVEVSLGAPENIALKERVITSLLEQVEGVTYINVRDPENPTYRGI